MDIAKLKELLGAATPGPWAVRQEDHEMPWCVTSESLPYVAAMVMSAKYGTEAANAALIVAAVNALPSLIARVEAAEGLRDSVEKVAETTAPTWISDAINAALTTYDQEKARG